MAEDKPPKGLAAAIIGAFAIIVAACITNWDKIDKYFIHPILTNSPTGAATPILQSISPSPQVLTPVPLATSYPTLISTITTHQPKKHNGIYTINRKEDSKNSDLTLEQVELTDNATIVRMRFTNTFSHVRTARVGSPKSLIAFRIYTEDYTDSYQLLSVIGVRTDEVLEITPEKSFTFTLRFARIPDTLTRFHLVEGDGAPEPKRTSWTFTGIKIPEQ